MTSDIQSAGWTPILEYSYLIRNTLPAVDLAKADVELSPRTIIQIFHIYHHHTSYAFYLQFSIRICVLHRIASARLPSFTVLHLYSTHYLSEYQVTGLTHWLCWSGRLLMFDKPPNWKRRLKYGRATKLDEHIPFHYTGICRYSCRPPGMETYTVYSTLFPYYCYKTRKRIMAFLISLLWTGYYNWGKSARCSRVNQVDSE
jgi:hypothetical protein